MLRSEVTSAIRDEAPEPAGDSSRGGLGHSLLESALAVAIALALVFATDLGIALLLAGHGPTGYVVLVAKLDLAIATAAILAAAVTPRPLPLALALWAAAHGLTLGGLTLQLAGGSALAALTIFFAWSVPHHRRTATALGLGVGFALAIGWIAVPALAEAIWPELLVRRGASTVMPIAAFAAGLAASSALIRLPLRASPPMRVGLVGALTLSAVIAAIAAHAPKVASLPAPASSRPNMLVLVLDTVRADRLSVYGYSRDTTPSLQRLLDDEARATLYPRAYSTASWTLPAHASLFTGVLPSEHQVHFGNGGLEGHAWSVTLPTTLAGVLADEGYRNAAVVANYALMTVGGLEAGFHRFDLAPAPRLMRTPGDGLRRRAMPEAHRKQGLGRANATQVNRAVLDELGRCQSGGCFLLANYMEAHEPYIPDAPYAGRFSEGRITRGPLTLRLPATREQIDYVSRVYDEEILDLDARLGELIESLRARALLDGLWLVITSDHGEAFLEHDSILHASSLYDEQVRIPLIIVPPKGQRLATPDGPVSLVDVTATLSAIATDQILGEGRDLRSDASRPSPVAMEFFGYEGKAAEMGPDAERPARAVLEDRWKLLEIDREVALYDLEADPGEQKDRATVWPGEVSRLAPALPPLEIRSDRVQAGDGALDEDALMELRAIGYVD